MSFWILLILAITQGLTEFLPISSSGHLVMLNNFFGIDSDIKLLSILLHIATLLSVVIYYRKEILQLIRHPLCPTNRKIVISTLFTCLVVLILKPLIDMTFNGDYIFVFFTLTALLLFIGDYMAERRHFKSRTCNFVAKNISVSTSDITDIGVSYKQAILIGITQGIACIPGISRSGSTIAVGQISGACDNAKYSFLISIPIIILSFVMEILEGGISTTGANSWGLILSMVICFSIGLYCIRLMSRLVAKNKMALFGYYLLGLSTILVVLSFF